MAREIEVFWFDNATGSNAITSSNLFSNVYMQDDHTVTLATGTGSAIAGRVWMINSLLGVAIQPNPVLRILSPFHF